MRSENGAKCLGIIGALRSLAELSIGDAVPKGTLTAAAGPGIRRLTGQVAPITLILV